MHEVGIISSMLKTIEKVMEQENLTTVETIVLQVGELSGVVPHYMRECFPAATYKTRFQDTRLELEVIPGIVRCNRCQTEFNGYACDLVCPECGNNRDLTRVSGSELMIKEIHGY